MSEGEEYKGGFPPGQWVGRCASVFQQHGFSPFESECFALAAWDVADADCSPREAAVAELTYMREDSE